MAGIKDQMKMVRELQKAQKELKKEIVEVEAGDGAVVIQFTGELKVKSVKLDPELIDLDDIEELEHWVQIAIRDGMEEARKIAEEKMASKTPYAIAYHGNIVEILEYAIEHNKHIDLLSDQTSCHAVYDGGYCPVGTSFEERTKLLGTDRPKFRELVNEGLRDTMLQSKNYMTEEFTSSIMETLS